MEAQVSTYRNMEDRLLARSVAVDLGFESPCWWWLGRVEPNGYAKVGVYLGGGRENEKVRNYWVHRVAYETFNCETVPDKYDVDHRCRQPQCINPEHLRAVPRAQNRNTYRSKP